MMMIGIPCVRPPVYNLIHNNGGVVQNFKGVPSHASHDMGSAGAGIPRIKKRQINFKSFCPP